MEEKINKIELSIGEINSSVKSAHKRIDDLQTITKAFYDLASDVKVMVNEMTNMKKDITDIKTNMDNYHRVEPDKLMFNVKNTIVTGIIAAIVTAIITLVLK